MATAQKIVEGQTATNHSTGERIVYRGGKWFPMGANNGGMSGALSAVERASVDDAQTSARSALDQLPDINRFQEKNAATETGGAHRWNDAIQGVWDPNFQQINEISARMTPGQRTPGSGTTSDRDLALFQQAVPSRKNNKDTNDAILDRGRAEAVRRQAYADFLDKYAAEHGTLNGAQAGFRAQEGLGTRETPFTAEQAGDRSQLPRAAYYLDPEGNLRRNDNGPRGNPIIRRAGMTQRRQANPQRGQVVDGFRYNGGPPGDPNSWSKQ